MRLTMIVCLFSGLICAAQTDTLSENLLNKGTQAYSIGDYTSATDYFIKCIAIAKSSDNKKLLGTAYNNLGNIYSKTGNSEASLKNYLLSIDQFSQVKDRLNTAKSYKNIGALYAEQKDFPTAIQYYNQSISVAKLLKDHSLMADCYNNLGVVYEQQNKFDEALDVYNKALPIYKDKGDEGKISMTLNNLAIVYKLVGNYPQSIANYEEAIRLSKKLDDKFMVAANQNNLGNVYVLTGNFPKALELCTIAYNNAKAINAKEITVEALDGISTAYEKLNQPANALTFRKRYEAEKDSYINTERSAQLADMQVKYETQKKADEILLLQNEGKIKTFEIDTQKHQIATRNFFIMAFLVILITLFGIAYFWISKQRLKNHLQRVIDIKETEEHERLRIARDIHDDLGSGLTKINFLSELIYQKTQHLPEVSSSSKVVMESAQSMIGNMRDLIWVLNTDNATIANLVSRMREYTTDYLEEFEIELKYTIQEGLPQTPIGKECHRELFMVVKEILNNISKHSKATEVYFSVAQTEADFEVLIRDNGMGFDLQTIDKGNGLKNIKNRIERIGGDFNLYSDSTGTEICFLISNEKLKSKEYF